MTVRIVHGPRCCVFLPDRPVRKRVIAGKAVWMWPWERWKHIELGELTITLPAGPHGGEVTVTNEGLPCRVTAELRVEIGASEGEDRETLLEIATEFYPPAHRSHDPIKVDFFKPVALTEIRSCIARVIRERKYIQLIEDAEYRANAYKEIRGFLDSALKKRGLMLLPAGFVVVEPQQPEGVAATQALYEKWLLYKHTRDEAELATLRSEKAKEEEAEGILQQHDINRSKLEYAKKDEDRALELAEKTKANEHDQQILKIQEERDERAFKYRLGNLDIDSKVKEEEARLDETFKLARMAFENRELTSKVANQVAALEIESKLKEDEARLSETYKLARLAFSERELSAKIILEKQQELHKSETEDVVLRSRIALGRKELTDKMETEQLQTTAAIDLQERQLMAREASVKRESEMLAHEREISKTQVEMTLQAAVAEREAGLAKAEISRMQSEAAVAGSLKMREALLTHLPQILLEANKPLEKAGKINVFALAGGRDGEPVTHTLNELLRGYSSLNIFKEIIEFLKSVFDETDK